MPYLHVKMAPEEPRGETDGETWGQDEPEDEEPIDEGVFASLAGEAEPFKI